MEAARLSAEEVLAPPLDVKRSGNHYIARFSAMACPCEVLIETKHIALARSVAEIAAQCAWRIEAKFSRYRTDNIVHRINTANGAPVTVDDETANLLDFAEALTRISEGRFDITSGVLRRAWTFDGSDRVPSQSQIDELRQFIGWHKVRWSRPQLQLLPQMQIDLGGIGKEYAVDAAARLIEEEVGDISCVVNFGGDVVVRHPRKDGSPWRIGIEAAAAPGSSHGLIALQRGGLATSGDSRRFIISNGHRYSHILDAQTGWPVTGPVRSITVAAGTCTQAGALSTLAFLKGEQAASFLDSHGVRYWLQ